MAEQVGNLIGGLVVVLILYVVWLSSDPNE
jgi:formate/nitrite transporter FocA (FNT family)